MPIPGNLQYLPFTLIGIILGDVSDRIFFMATFRIGFYWSAQMGGTVQQNPIRNVAEKIPFPGENIPGKPDSISTYLAKREISGGYNALLMCYDCVPMRY